MWVDTGVQLALLSRIVIVIGFASKLTFYAFASNSLTELIKKTTWLEICYV